MKASKNKKSTRGSAGKYERPDFVGGKPEGMRNGGPVRGYGKAKSGSKVKYC
jgi:hypothetical protein